MERKDIEITEEILVTILGYIKRMYSDSEISQILKIGKDKIKRLRKQFETKGLWGLKDKYAIENKIKDMAVDGKSIEEVSKELNININFVREFYLKLQKLKIIDSRERNVSINSVGYNFQRNRKKTANYAHSLESEEEKIKSNKSQTNKKEMQNLNQDEVIDLEIIEKLKALFDESNDDKNKREEYTRNQEEMDSEVKKILVRLKLTKKLQKGDMQILRAKVKISDVNNITFKEIIRTLTRFGYLEQVVDFIEIKENQEAFFNLIQRRKYIIFKNEVKRIILHKKIINLLKRGDLNNREIAEKLEIDEITVTSVAQKYGIKSVNNFQEL